MAHATAREDSVFLGTLPAARVYHTLCTGYAGLFAARAHLETGRPALLTEHGIYTNERRIEITMADWLREEAPGGLTIDRQRRDLKTLWIEPSAASRGPATRPATPS